MVDCLEYNRTMRAKHFVVIYQYITEILRMFPRLLCAKLVRGLLGAHQESAVQLNSGIQEIAD